MMSCFKLFFVCLFHRPRFGTIEEYRLIVPVTHTSANEEKFEAAHHIAQKNPTYLMKGHGV